MRPHYRYGDDIRAQQYWRNQRRLARLHPRKRYIYCLHCPQRVERHLVPEQYRQLPNGIHRHTYECYECAHTQALEMHDWLRRRQRRKDHEQWLHRQQTTDTR